MDLRKDSYWEDRYNTGKDGWDIGHISPPLKAFTDRLGDKTIKILVPGAGNGYEAEYLFRQGFTNTYILDFAAAPLNHFKARVPDFPDSRILHEDFFNVRMQFDLILEQTFFCAIPPSSRPDYVRQMHRLLHPGGTLAGLLFDFPLTEDGPPFGGSREAYTTLFTPYFDISIMETCYNSIPPRAGRELFFKVQPKTL